MPRLKKKELDSRDFPAPERTYEAVETADGPGLDGGAAPVIDSVLNMDEAAALAFNEEVLTIVIHQSGEKLPEDPVEVSVQGRRCFIWRGQQTLTKRKYVERLLLAQVNSVNQDITQQEEKAFNRLRVVPTQRYPVSIIKDPSKLGAQWLQSITQGA